MNAKTLHELPLRDIQLPEAVSWWPPGYGWWLLAALALACAAAWLVRRSPARRRAARARRLALRELDAVEARFRASGDARAAAAAMSVLLRRFALELAPRAEVAALTGERWVAWLAARAATPGAAGTAAAVAEWPAALLLLPLPLLARRLLPATRAERMTALRTPFAGEFETAGAARAVRTARAPVLLAAAALALLALAAARPQYAGEPVPVAVPARDLMLAVDLSGSMQTADFALGGRIVDRLSATKAVAVRFIRRREGDRLGLILFGRNAYVQVPLTFDRTTVEALLREAVIGLAGRNTAIGDAIGLAVKRLAQSPAPSRVLILMTDGANTAGSMEPEKAAALAARAGLRIHTIGIGGDARASSVRGARRAASAGAPDEETLRAVAAHTGGQYFRAHDTAELERIYAELDRIEPVDSEEQTFRPTTSLYPWPLAAALALCAALLLMRTGARHAA